MSIYGCVMCISLLIGTKRSQYTYRYSLSQRRSYKNLGPVQWQPVMHVIELLINRSNHITDELFVLNSAQRNSISVASLYWTSRVWRLFADLQCATMIDKSRNTVQTAITAHHPVAIATLRSISEHKNSQRIFYIVCVYISRHHSNLSDHNQAQLSKHFF